MKTYCAIYDFALLPYALGDVMTWCVKTAMKARERNCQYVDIYLRVSSDNCAAYVQAGHVSSENHKIYLSELYSAFQAHPLLRNLHIFADPDDLLKSISNRKCYDDIETHEIETYEDFLSGTVSSQDRHNYLLRQIHLHDDINQYYNTHHEIPKLNTQLAEPDLDVLFSEIFRDRYVVLIQPRLRQLDRGFCRVSNHRRDSNYLEWYDFIRRTENEYPCVAFVLLGRLSEKPLSLLRLKNVFSLRTFGCTLIHEIALFQRAHLFMGASSGFAAVANFTDIPYYITKITEYVCEVYNIPFGSSHLPFASSFQTLVYEDESSRLLSDLLVKGLRVKPSLKKTVEHDEEPVVDLFTTEYEFRSSKFATVSRVDFSRKFESLEVISLLNNALQKAFELFNKEAASKEADLAEVRELLGYISSNFSEHLAIVPEYWKIQALLSKAEQDELHEQLYEKKFQELARRRSLWLRYRAAIWHFRIFIFNLIQWISYVFSLVSKQLRKSVKLWIGIDG